MRVFFAAVLVSGAAVFGQSTGPAPNETIFSQKLAPLLKANCGQCHGGTSPAGGLAMAGLDSVLTGGKHGPAIEPGNSKQSLLMQYIRGEPTPKMPMGGALA